MELFRENSPIQIVFFCNSFSKHTILFYQNIDNNFNDMFESLFVNINLPYPLGNIKRAGAMYFTVPVTISEILLVYIKICKS